MVPNSLTFDQAEASGSIASITAPAGLLAFFPYFDSRRDYETDSNTGLREAPE
jgi:hypothetical protein